MTTTNPVQAGEEDKCPTSESLIPEEFICKLCNGLMTDVMMVPCCADSYCSGCIRKVLSSSGDQKCPNCHKEEISLETLIPNRFLRNQINKFKSKSSKNDDNNSNKVEEKEKIPETTTTINPGETPSQQHEMKTVKSTKVDDASNNNNNTTNLYYESTYYNPELYGQKQNYNYHPSSSTTVLKEKTASSFSAMPHHHHLPTGLIPLNQPPPSLYYPYHNNNVGYETGSSASGKYAESPYPQIEQQEYSMKNYSQGGEAEERKYSYIAPTTIADPLKEFEKFIREKDKEKEKKNHQDQKYDQYLYNSSGINERREPRTSSSFSYGTFQPRPFMNYQYPTTQPPPPSHYLYHPYRPPPNFRYPNYRQRRPYPHLNPNYYPPQFFNSQYQYRMKYRRGADAETCIVFRERDKVPTTVCSGGDPRQMFTERSSTFPRFQSYEKSGSNRIINNNNNGQQSCTSNLVPVPQQEDEKGEIKKEEEKEDEKPLISPQSPSKDVLNSSTFSSSIHQSQDNEALPQHFKSIPSPSSTFHASPSTTSKEAIEVTKGNQDVKEVKLEKISKSPTARKQEDVEKWIREKSYTKGYKTKSRESSVSSGKSHKKSKNKDKDNKKERKLKKSHKRKKEKKEKSKRKIKKDKKKKSKSSNEMEEEYSSEAKSTLDEDEGKTTEDETETEIDSPYKKDHNLSTQSTSTVQSNEDEDNSTSTSTNNIETTKEEVKNSNDADDDNGSGSKNNATTAQKTEIEEDINIQNPVHFDTDKSKSNCSPNPCDSTVSPDRLLQKDND